MITNAARNADRHHVLVVASTSQSCPTITRILQCLRAKQRRHGAAGGRRSGRVYTTANTTDGRDGDHPSQHGRQRRRAPSPTALRAATATATVAPACHSSTRRIAGVVRGVAPARGCSQVSRARSNVQKQTCGFYTRNFCGDRRNGCCAQRASRAGRRAASPADNAATIMISVRPEAASQVARTDMPTNTLMCGRTRPARRSCESGCPGYAASSAATRRRNVGVSASVARSTSTRAAPCVYERSGDGMHRGTRASSD